jgi:hypothetical protein
MVENGKIKLFSRIARGGTVDLRMLEETKFPEVPIWLHLAVAISANKPRTPADTRFFDENTSMAYVIKLTL